MPVINRKKKIIDLVNFSEVINVFNILMLEKADEAILNIRQYDFLLGCDDIRRNHLDLCTERAKLRAGYMASFINREKKTEIWVRKCQ